MMASIILRFRDLSIPLGETLRRHRHIAKRHSYVWWGWMKRNREGRPNSLLSETAAAASERVVSAYLYDSGTDRIHAARLSGIAALPNDDIPSPEPGLTPSYMAEAILPAWFKLSDISPEPLTRPVLAIHSLPTLPDETDTDSVTLDQQFSDLATLRKSGATMWSGEIISS